MDVKTEEKPADQTVQNNIENKIALVFSGVESGEIKKEYLDISVTKTVNGGNANPVEDVKRVLEIAVKYDLSGKFNPVVIREHKGSVVAFTALKSKPESNYKDGTFFVEHSTGTIYIYSEFFSTYSIAYATTASYTVSFDAQGGSGVNAIVVKAGGTIPAASIPTSSRIGYSFDGWFTAASGGEKLTSSTVIDGDITYFAHWTKNTPPSPPDPPVTKYTVSFDMGGHGTAIASQTIISGGKVTKPAPDPVAEGYDFGGW